MEVPLGIVGELPAERHLSLHRQPWATDRLRLMVGADNPLAQADALEPALLRDQSLILREPGSSTRAYAEGMLLDYVGQFGRVLELTSPEAVKEAVVAGLGVAVLSSWATRREEGAGLLFPVPIQALERERLFYLVRRCAPALGPAARTLWDFLARQEGQQ